MDRSINFDKVADLYDYYVNVDTDIPFFLKETDGTKEEILELMCGTGRVSVPLLKAGRRLVCVDYSEGMLEKLKNKLTDNDLQADLVHADITALNLERKFQLIILPFHSISEIQTCELQIKALKAIYDHLEKGGTFICTLQNPYVRLKSADGMLKVIGDFPASKNNRLLVSFVNSYDERNGIVSGYQFYEIYNDSNVLLEKRFLKIMFRPVSDKEFRTMLEGVPLKITEVYGDYSYSKFDETSSAFIIYKLIKS